jgi:hypothetical protein
VTERDSAIHAAGGLLPRCFVAERAHEFAEMTHAIGRRLVAPIVAVYLEEAGDFTHHCAATL